MMTEKGEFLVYDITWFILAIIAIFFQLIYFALYLAQMNNNNWDCCD